MSLVWKFFSILLGVWKQQNDILYDQIDGATNTYADKRIWRIYEYKYFYTLADDAHLFKDFPITEALELPTTFKNQCLDTLYLSIKDIHGSLYFLNKIPTNSIDSYFPIQY